MHLKQIDINHVSNKYGHAVTQLTPHQYNKSGDWKKAGKNIGASRDITPVPNFATLVFAKQGDIFVSYLVISDK
ncbi:MAG: hypothetical protein KDI38_06280 [Calditrichaeota bacterium]|nr:hypothetical protein [Calditrichota bacterium]